MLHLILFWISPSFTAIPNLDPSLKFIYSPHRKQNCNCNVNPLCLPLSHLTISTCEKLTYPNVMCGFVGRKEAGIFVQLTMALIWKTWQSSQEILGVTGVRSGSSQLHRGLTPTQEKHFDVVLSCERLSWNQFETEEFAAAGGEKEREN